MLRVSPEVFDTILCLIHDHPIFYNNSNNPQTDVQTQLAVTLVGSAVESSLAFHFDGAMTIQPRIIYTSKEQKKKYSELPILIHITHGKQMQNRCEQTPQQAYGAAKSQMHFQM